MRRGLHRVCTAHRQSPNPLLSTHATALQQHRAGRRFSNSIEFLAITSHHALPSRSNPTLCTLRLCGYCDHLYVSLTVPSLEYTSDVAAVGAA
jgi:hypothetical protein